MSNKYLIQVMNMRCIFQALFPTCCHILRHRDKLLKSKFNNVFNCETNDLNIFEWVIRDAKLKSLSNSSSHWRISVAFSLILFQEIVT